MTVTVIESFDPFTDNGDDTYQGDLLWTDIFAFLGTLTASTSVLHVTQGTGTWKALTAGANDEIGTALQISGYDLTGYTSISVDVYVAQVGGGDTALGIGDGNAVFPDTNSNLATSVGAHTLSIDLTTITDPINNVSINLVGGSNAFGGSGTGPAEVYWDNLRVDDGGGGGGGISIPVVMNHLRNQGMS